MRRGRTLLAAEIDAVILERLRKRCPELRVGKRDGTQIEQHRRSTGGKSDGASEEERGRRRGKTCGLSGPCGRRASKWIVSSQLRIHGCEQRLGLGRHGSGPVNLYGEPIL